MNHFQIAVPIGSLPLQLVCISDASVAIVRNSDFRTIIDKRGEVNAVFDNEGFSIGGESYQYNTKIFYKEIPSVLEWLQQQGLEAPTFH